jgi:hypothetical protein
VLQAACQTIRLHDEGNVHQWNQVFSFDLRAGAGEVFHRHTTLAVILPGRMSVTCEKYSFHVTYLAKVQVEDGQVRVLLIPLWIDMIEDKSEGFAVSGF